MTSHPTLRSSQTRREGSGEPHIGKAKHFSMAALTLLVWRWLRPALRRGWGRKGKKALICRICQFANFHGINTSDEQFQATSTTLQNVELRRDAHCFIEPVSQTLHTIVTSKSPACPSQVKTVRENRAPRTKTLGDAKAKQVHVHSTDKAYSVSLLELRIGLTY